ncbi:5870_t:CDS:2, partial [Funneliformis mosseae]
MSQYYQGNKELLEYLDSHKPEEWSLSRFLLLYRDKILTTPPFHDDWHALDGLWTRRFVWAVQERNEKIALETKLSLSRVTNDDTPNSFKVNSENNRLYWREIILDRMKIETKLVTDKEGLHTLHTSVQSHGERVRNSYDNCEEANVRVSKFIFEQDKPKDDHDESDEIDNFFKSPSEKKSSNLFLQKKDNSAKKQQKSSNERGFNEADDEKDKVVSEENDDSGFFSLGSQPISFCNASDTEGLADGSENKPFLVSEEEYAYLQEILNEDVRLPTPNKRGNEIEEDVSTRKKAKKTVKSTYSVEHPRSRNSEKSSFEDPS